MITSNISRQATQESCNEKARLLSFATTLSELSLPSIAASAAGFIHSPSPDGTSHIKCQFCQLELSSISSKHALLALHQLFSPNCSFLQRNKHVNATFLDSSNLTRPFEVSSILPATSESDTLQVTLTRPPAVHGTVPDVSTAAGSSDNPGQEDLSSTFVASYNRINTLRSSLPDTHILHISKPHTRQYISSNLTSEFNRLSTFENWPKEDVVAASSLAASGFVYTRYGDTVECVYCKVQISDWTGSSLPVDSKHIKSSRHCQFMQGSKLATNIPNVISPLLAVTAAPSSEVSAQLGIVTDAVNSPEFAVEARRKATFLTWPSANHKLASEMIEHHLYYKGHGDVVCCFSCGTEMSGWTSTDNIWRRHARQAPHCQLVIQEKGADWVAATIEEHGPYVPPQQEPTIITVTTRALRPRMDSPAAQLVLSMRNPSYEREEVRSTLIRNIKFGKPDFNCATSLVSAMMERRKERDELQRVQQEAETLMSMPVIICRPQRLSELESIEEVEEFPDMDAQEEIREETSLMDITSAVPTLNDPVISANVGNPIEFARSMRAQMICKICLDNVAGIVFLPCGHLVCCPDCAPAMVQCPLCRQEVRGTIRAYFDKL